jgi:hypothetical protein
VGGDRVFPGFDDEDFLLQGKILAENKGIRMYETEQMYFFDTFISMFLKKE